jgi:hypothetical protein
MEKELEELMAQIAQETDAIKVEIAKSNEKKLKGTSFNCAALKRLRKCLLNLEKVGFNFRKASVQYQKQEKVVE